MVGSAVVDLFWLMYIFIFYNLSMSSSSVPDHVHGLGIGGGTLAVGLVGHRLVLKKSSACPQGRGQSRPGRAWLVGELMGAAVVAALAQVSREEDCKGSVDGFVTGSAFFS